METSGVMFMDYEPFSDHSHDGRLDAAAAANELQDQNDDRDNEQDVDEITHRRTRKSKAECP